MKTYRTPLLVGVFALGLLALAGCDCGTRADCTPPPPAPVVRPILPTPPPCDPCGQPIAVRPAPVVVEAPLPVRPTRGVCWIDGPQDPVRLPDPPSVTLNRGAVVASTPAGRVQPPEPDLAFARGF
jgi:hypothetical protein